jgi:trk system potassium uptake protein TrkH
MILKFNINIKPTQTIVIGFMAIILVGSILLDLPIASRDGKSIGFINSLFTATSATCVTGLVIADTYTQWTLFGQIVILFLIQVGGLGFMTIATLFSFILKRKISLKERLVMIESLNQYYLQGVVGLVKRVIIGTFIIEGIGALLLSLRFVPDFGIIKGVYSGIFHAVSAFCNSGFDLMGQYGQFSSLTAYSGDVIVNLVVSVLIIIGSLGFAVWDDLYKEKSFKTLQLHSKLVLFITGLLLFFGFISFFLIEHGNVGTIGTLSFPNKLLASFFQSVSSRTAGFSTINLCNMRSGTVFITMLLMFIGGSPGSTAGGIKTTTAGVLLFAAIAVIKGKEDTEMFRRRISSATVTRAFTITLISALIVSCATIMLTTFEDLAFMEAFFEAVSAVGTAGLTLGVTSGLGVIGKIILVFAMFIGRVGILTMALALLEKPHSKYNKYRYMEEKVMIG